MARHISCSTACPAGLALPRESVPGPGNQKGQADWEQLGGPWEAERANALAAYAMTSVANGA